MGKPSTVPAGKKTSSVTSAAEALKVAIAEANEARTGTTETGMSKAAKKRARKKANTEQKVDTSDAMDVEPTKPTEGTIPGQSKRAKQRARKREAKESGGMDVDTPTEPVNTSDAGQVSKKRKRNKKKKKSVIQEPLKPEGGQKNKKKKGQKPLVGTVDEDFEIQEGVSYDGIVEKYNNRGGSGTIRLDTEGVVPGNIVRAHWKQISSTDRWPQLLADMKVKFELSKKKMEKGTYVIEAAKITNSDGGMINVQDDVDQKKQFIGDIHMRYTGKVKTYHRFGGRGTIELEEGYDVPEDTETTLQVSREEIAAGSDTPMLYEGMSVEFGIEVREQDGKKSFHAYQVTLDAGILISKAYLEERTELNGDFQGTVTKKGEIEVNVKDLPAEAKVIMERRKHTTIHFKNEDLKDAEQKPEVGAQVKFQLYTTLAGVHAHNISC